MSHSPTVLCILDGWGVRDESDHNAIAAANTPNYDQLLARYPHGVLDASERHVGLPDGQMGNSEVGHMTIGSGRQIMQDLPRIDHAIETGALAENEILKESLRTIKGSNGVLHLMGLVSDGGVHAHVRHMIALATIAANQAITVQLHLWLDGRDTPPRSAAAYIDTLESAIASLENVSIATLCGRFYAMDRDTRWQRTKGAYDAMVLGNADYHATSAADALRQSYDVLDQGDEFVPPFTIGTYQGMQDQDGFIVTNFRADRARQITTAFCDPDFDGFERGTIIAFSSAASMGEYSAKHSRWLETLFPPEEVRNTLGEVVASEGQRQLRIAETEKYAHVTFFANGGREEPFDGEERILIPSPDVETYDLQPEMSAHTLTDDLVEAIRDGSYAFIFVNYANPDMVGHTGNFDAAVKAIETIDLCLGRLHEAIRDVQGALIVSADHGNVEAMFDHDSNQPHTAHTLNQVPVLLVAADWEGASLEVTHGTLADLAPTALEAMGLQPSTEMTGHSLLRHMTSRGAETRHG